MEPHLAFDRERVEEYTGEFVLAIPSAAAALAGFVLAHAAWSVSDLPKDELLVPVAIIEQNGHRQLLRFEADTQEQAIARGKSAMQTYTSTADAWAFARDGFFRRGGKKVDVISVDFWSKGMSASVTLVQEYEPFAKSGRFRIVGDPLLVVNGRLRTPNAAADALAHVRAGVRSHPKVAPLWDTWR